MRKDKSASAAVPFLGLSLVFLLDVDALLCLHLTEESTAAAPELFFLLRLSSPWLVSGTL